MNAAVPTLSAVVLSKANKAVLEACREDAAARTKKEQRCTVVVLMAAGKLTTDNSTALGACREAAAKTKKEQRCTILVPAT